MNNKKLSLYDAITYALKAVCDDARFFMRWTVLYNALLLGAFAGLALLSLPVLMGALPYLKQVFMQQGVYHASFAGMGVLFAAQAGLTVGVLVLAALLVGFLAAGFYHVLFAYFDNGTQDLRLLFSGTVQESFKILVTLVLWMTLIGFGFLFFFVPGVIALVRFRYALFCIVDYDAGIIQSLQDSWEMTRGNAWEQLFLTILFAVPVAAFSPWMLFVLWPLSMVASLHVYRQLCPLDDVVDAA